MASFVGGNRLNFTKTLVLGDLSGLESKGCTGTGLYAENVFLYGSLTTQIPTDQSTTYAGINTNSQVTKNDETIIIFAGAEGAEVGQIKGAPFYVTDQGNLYASKGTFSGTIKSSEIIGSTIEAATIIGNGNNPALTIKDTSAGIVFSSNSPNVPVLKINTNGFTNSLNEQETNFISFEVNDNKIQTKFTGDGFNILNGLELDKESLIGKSNKVSIKGQGIYFNNTNGSIEVTDDSFISRVGVNFQERVSFGSGAGEMVFKEVQGLGYDLYIQQE